MSDLRAAAAAMVALHTDADGRTTACNGECSAWPRLRAALAATPEPTLDAERLATAIRMTEQTHTDEMGIVGPATDGPPPEWYVGYAARIAAEYVRLHERTEP